MCGTIKHSVQQMLWLEANWNFCNVNLALNCQKVDLDCWMSLGLARKCWHVKASSSAFFLYSSVHVFLGPWRTKTHLRAIFVEHGHLFFRRPQPVLRSCWLSKRQQGATQKRWPTKWCCWSMVATVFHSFPLIPKLYGWNWWMHSSTFTSQGLSRQARRRNFL